MPASASRGFEHYTVRDSANPPASGGGHVESSENTEEAAIREAREETGLDVQLLPGPAAPVPAGYPHKVLCAPWWITEMRASFSEQSM